VVVVAVIALAELTRSLRWLNVPAGLWLISAPWLLAGSPATASWLSVTAGAALIILNLRRGVVREQYVIGVSAHQGRVVPRCCRLDRSVGACSRSRKHDAARHR
jgi:hypothetical protein